MIELAIFGVIDAVSVRELGGRTWQVGLCTSASSSLSVVVVLLSKLQ